MSAKEANAYYKRQIDYTVKAYNTENLLPRRYVLVLTNLCNLACSFCFQERKKRADRMLTNDWINLIDQIPQGSRITLTGGDPFMFKDFLKIFKKANQKAETNMITNGILLQDDKINALLEEENFKVLAISVDTIGNTNRDVKPEHWKKFLTQLDKFNSLRNKLNKKTSLDIKTVILEENIPDLFKIHKFAVNELRADTHSFMLLKGADIQHSDIMFDFDRIDEKTNAYEYQNFDELINQLNLIKNYDKKNNKKSYLHPTLINFQQDKDFKKEDLTFLNNKEHIVTNFSKCYAPWGGVYINVDGSLFPCMAVAMGNVKTEKLKDIIFSEKFMKFKSKLKSHGTLNGCNRCGYLKSKNFYQNF